MAQFLLKRLFQSAFTILGVMTAAFFLTRLAGEPALLLLSAEASAEELARIREAYGLDRPLVVQCGVFLLNAVQGDFGMSFRQAVPAMTRMPERLPATLELALSVFVIGVGLALVLSILMRLTNVT